MSADRFITLIEQQLLLPDQMVRTLRAKVAATNPPTTAEDLAKLLIQKNLLTVQQASTLLSQLASAAPSPPSDPMGNMSSDLLFDDDAPGSSSIFASGIGKQNPDGEEEVFTLTPVDNEVEEESSQIPAIGGAFAPVASALPSSGAFPGPSTDDPEVYLSASSSSLRASPSSVVRKRADDKVKKELARRAAERTGNKTAPTLKKKTKKSKEWESPFFLIGGGILVLLVLVGGTTALLLNWRGGDEKLDQARKARDAGSFGQAIGFYNEFVEGFSSHAMWSTARVELAMVRLRQAVDGGGSMEPALKIAQSELQGLESDAAFDQEKLPEGHKELADLLPKIASGLVEQANAAIDDPQEAQRLSKEANAALELCRNAKYVPKQLRDEPALAEVEERLARVSRRQQTRIDLDAGLAAIKAAIDSGDTRAAYATHRKLLEDHPELLTNEQLKATIVAASAAEKDGVKFVADEQAAETTERPTPWLAALATGDRHSLTPAPATGVYCARVDGAVYAFDVASGKLLWRRYVGFAKGMPPLTAGENVLVFDSEYQELLALAASTGKLVWRQEIGEPIAEPLAVRDRAYVAAESGKLYIVDLSSGARMGYLQFAQPLKVTPIVDSSGERLYLTGDHSSMYTISLVDLTCQGAFYLGHTSGSIRVSPVQTLDRLAVLENDGIATSRLRLLSVDDKGSVNKVETERRLQGLAASPPLATSRRLIAVSDRGQLDAFDVGSAEGDKALTQVATREATSRTPLVRHVLLTQGAIWVGDTQLTKYAVLPTGNRLPVQSIDNSFVRSTFDSPLGLFDKVLIHVRRPDDRAGVIVSAIDTESGKMFWENILAVPPAATPIVDDANRTLAFADVNGLIFRFDDAAIRSRVQDQPLAGGVGGGEVPKLTVGVDLGAGRAAFAAPGESDQLVLYDPTAARNAVRRNKLPSTIVCAMSPFGKGVLVPLEVGQVFYLNPSDGQPLAMPFQPRLQARMKVPYQPAAQVDDAGRQFVITDGHEKIYLVELVDSSEPHFDTVKDGSVGAFPIVRPMVVIDQTVFAVTDGGQLTRFTLPSLETAGQTALPGDVVWGPYRIGDLLLVVTANDQLVAVNKEGGIAWSDSVKGGDLAGPPLATDNGVLLTYRKGILEHRGIADGQPVGSLDVEHPLSAGPVRFMDRIVLTAHDGTLLVVQQP